MRVRVTLDDLNNAGEYTEPNRCLLATALKRIYGKDADMNVHHFKVKGILYYIPKSQMKKLYNAYAISDVAPQKYTGEIVNKTPFTIYAERRG